MANFPILEKVSVGLGGVDGLFLVHVLVLFGLKYLDHLHFVTYFEVVVWSAFSKNLILDFRPKSIPATTVQNLYLSGFQILQFWSRSPISLILAFWCHISEVVVWSAFRKNLILDFRPKSIPATTVQNLYLSGFQISIFLIYGPYSGFSLQFPDPEKS
jgi:hypothetical protein